MNIFRMNSKNPTVTAIVRLPVKIKTRIVVVRVAVILQVAAFAIDLLFLSPFFFGI